MTAALMILAVIVAVMVLAVQHYKTRRLLKAYRKTYGTAIEQTAEAADWNAWSNELKE